MAARIATIRAFQHRGRPHATSSPRLTWRRSLERTLKDSTWNSRSHGRTMGEFMSMKKHHPSCAKLNEIELENTCDCMKKNNSIPAEGTYLAFNKMEIWTRVRALKDISEKNRTMRTGETGKIICRCAYAVAVRPDGKKLTIQTGDENALEVIK
jgi:hypothetical protein